MHPLTHELLKDGCHSLYMDKIITDYLKSRAEWLLNQYNDHKEKDEIIREAFELPKEEKCSCGAWNCGHTKPIPSQPEKEPKDGVKLSPPLPNKLRTKDWSQSAIISKVDEIIDYLQSLTKLCEEGK